MLQAYRLHHLSRRYPSFVVVLHRETADGTSWYAQLMDVTHPDWWREWRSPRQHGARWVQARWLLGLVRIERWKVT